MMNAQQLRLYIVRPTLRYINLWSANAEELVLGTAAQESGLAFIKQLGGGPGLGLYQCEPATHDDIWRNYLPAKPVLASKLYNLQTMRADDFHEELMGNLFYATGICRVHYRRVPVPLPAAGDIEGMARYWKRYYNTEAGRGTESQFIASYYRYIYESYPSESD